MKIEKTSIDRIREAYRSATQRVEGAEAFEKAVVEKSGATDGTGPHPPPGASKLPPGGASEVAVREAATPEVRAADIVARTPDVREDRVAELKRRIEAGEYRVDAEAVAARLLTSGVLDEGE